MEAEELEQDRREHLTDLESILYLNPTDYALMRNYITYDPPMTSACDAFYKKEQELIFNEVYVPFEYKVCPEKAVSVQRLHDMDHTKRATWICEKLGLNNLIERRCDYNVWFVQQFFATLVIGEGPNIPLTWMTNDQRYDSDFVRFAQLLGYPFISVDQQSGSRMHNQNGVYDKEAMAPMYLSATFTPGYLRGLNRLFNTLLRIFRNNIAHEIGNLDAIRGGLVNLMVYAQWIDDAEKIGGDVDNIQPIDVMDFIFREIKECIL